MQRSRARRIGEVLGVLQPRDRPKPRLGSRGWWLMTAWIAVWMVVVVFFILPHLPHRF